MSTILMSACWPLQGMSPAQKAVLISLADQANDDGYCWPSVGTIAGRTCLSERAVQGAIKWLQAAGLLGASERRGTSSVYQITPADAAPKPSMNRQLNQQEPKKRASASVFELPGWVPADTWAAFMETRKAKKAKSTDYALSLIVKDLERFKAAGHDPVAVLNNSIKAGWSDVYPPKAPASAMTPGRRTPAPENFAARTYTGGKL